VRKSIADIMASAYERDHVLISTGGGLAGFGEEDAIATIGHNFEAVIADLETRMREAAADLDFEEAARLRDEIKRLRSTELAVIDDPTAKAIAISRGGSPSPARGGSRAAGARGGVERPRKPTLDEMGPGPDKELRPHRGPRSTSGRAGMRGGWRPRRR
jgi:excinuclease ABC subunit B